MTFRIRFLHDQGTAERYQRTEEPLLAGKRSFSTLEVVMPQAGRLSSTVRRMKAEKELGIPVHLRTGAAISVADGKPANELNDYTWERFFQRLCGELKVEYPEMYEGLFGNESLE